MLDWPPGEIGGSTFQVSLQDSGSAYFVKALVRMLVAGQLLNAIHALGIIRGLFLILREGEITCLTSLGSEPWAPALQRSFFLMSQRKKYALLWGMFTSEIQSGLPGQFLNLPELLLPHLGNGNNDTYFTGLLYQ